MVKCLLFGKMNTYYNDHLEIIKFDNHIDIDNSVLTNLTLVIELDIYDMCISRIIKLLFDYEIVMHINRNKYTYKFYHQYIHNELHKKIKNKIKFIDNKVEIPIILFSNFIFEYDDNKYNGFPLYLFKKDYDIKLYLYLNVVIDGLELYKCDVIDDIKFKYSFKCNKYIVNDYIIYEKLCNVYKR